jgi:UTP-glucose-1-phosphate uridylyltransferase
MQQNKLTSLIKQNALEEIRKHLEEPYVSVNAGQIYTASNFINDEEVFQLLLSRSRDRLNEVQLNCVFNNALFRNWLNTAKMLKQRYDIEIKRAHMEPCMNGSAVDTANFVIDNLLYGDEYNENEEDFEYRIDVSDEKFVDIEIL